jgi:hypothetical protein
MLYIKYYWDDQMKEGEMSGACSMHGRNEKHNNWLDNLKGRDHLGDLYVDGRIMLDCNLKK